MPSKRVLIVDDAVELNRMLRAAIEALIPGVEVKIYPSAEEAVLELMHRTYDLMIVDIRLPGISGLDLTHRLREAGNNIKIFLITGLAVKDLDEKARAAGADRFLVKPFLMSEFLEITAELLDVQPVTEPTVKVPAKNSPPGPEEIDRILKVVQTRLGAKQVLLINAKGEIAAQTDQKGRPEFDKNWLQVVLSAVSGVDKASSLVTDGGSRGAMVLPGDRQQLVLAPVGGMVLVIVLGADGTTLRSALAIDEALEVQKQLANLNAETNSGPLATLPAVIPEKTAVNSPVMNTVVTRIKTVKAEPAPASDKVEPARVETKTEKPEEPKPPAGPDIIEKPVETAAKPVVKAPAGKETKKTVSPFTDYSEEELEKLKTLLDESQPDENQAVSDDFWEQGLKDVSDISGPEGGLTYEEASQLGLIADES